MTDEVVQPNAIQDSNLGSPNKKPKSNKASGKKNENYAKAGKGVLSYPNLGNGVAFNKSIVVTNGELQACRYQEILDAAMGDSGGSVQADLAPVLVQRVSGRTARKDSQAENTKDKKDTTLYESEEALIPKGYDAVHIAFGLSVRNAAARPHSISATGFKALRDNGFFEAMERTAEGIFGHIAENVFSGKWAWRNHDEASALQVFVYDSHGAKVRDAQELSRRMLEVFQQNRGAEHFSVRGVFRLGFGDSDSFVYPSQLLKTGKGQSARMKEFFRVENGHGTSAVALRGVKIGNRLKVMDSWYRHYPEYLEVMPVDPLGYDFWLSALLREQDETLPHYLNTILGSDKAAAQSVLQDENACRFVCANILFGCLVTESKGEKPDGSKTKDGEDEGEDGE